MRPDPRSRPPVRTAKLLRLLYEREIDWVLSGSAVLVLYGADLRPNDLDVVPLLDSANLRRLAGLLLDVDAVPAYRPDGSTLEECLAWTPEPPTAGRLDHLFVTSLGMLDIPPTSTGSYLELAPDATELELAGVPVCVCAPGAVLDRLPAKPRAQDVARAGQYAVVREALRGGRAPRSAPWFEQ